MTKTVARRPVPERAVKPGGNMRAFLDAARNPSRLLTPIERHLLTRTPPFRASNVLHPSEMIATDWCHRESYHLLRGAEAKPERNGLRTSTIFDEGHEIHRKWQMWLREMGKLYGQWGCLACEWSGWGTAPRFCIFCKRVDTLVYQEVPLVSVKHRIAGHADGWVQGLGEDCLIEIKSIGIGTVRMEAPALLANADGDLDKLWGSIRRPFGKHLRQGQMYLALAQEVYGESAPKEIVFLYENKMNQASREFVVRYDPEISAPLLEAALDLAYAIDNSHEPACNVKRGGCARCKRFS